MNEQTVVLGVMGLYLVGILWVGYRLRQQVEVLDDFILSGRGLPWFILSMTMLATLANAQQTLGIAGFAYNSGMAFLFWFFVIVNLVIYPTIKRLGTRYRQLSFSTVVDLAEARFPGSRRLVVLMSFWQVLWGVVSIGICLFGGALLVESVFGVPWQLALFIVLVVSVGYTIMGGLRAVVITDVVQWVIITLGTALFVPLVFVRHGSFTAFFSKLLGAQGWTPAAGVDLWPGFTDLFTLPPAMLWPLIGFGIAGSLWIPIDLGFIQRMLAARNPREGQKGSVMFLVTVTLWATLMLAMGAYGRVLFPGLGNPDTVIIHLARDSMPLLGAALFVTAVAGAVMSTVDTYLSAAGAILTKNIYQRFVSPGRSDAHYIAAARAFTVVVALLAVLVAPLVSISGIFMTALAVQMIICASLAPMMLLATFWRRLSEPVAFWGNVVSAGFTLYLVYAVGGPAAAMFGAGLRGVPVIFFGLGVAIPLYLAGSYLFPARREDVGEQFLALFEGRVQPERVSNSDIKVLGGLAAVAALVLAVRKAVGGFPAAFPPLSGPAAWLTDAYLLLVAAFVILISLCTLVMAYRWIKAELQGPRDAA